MTTRQSMPRALRTPSACSTPTAVLNASQRALPRIVPPCWMMPPTSRGPSGESSPPRSPAKPWRTPKTLQPCANAARTTARIAAFMPGASPPLVRTAMLLILSPFIPRSGGGGERPFCLPPRRHEVRHDTRAEDGEARRLEPFLGREEDEAPEEKRDERRQRVEPHAERAREIRPRLPEDERRRDLRDERDDRADRHDGRDDGLEVQEREHRGCAAEREERDDGIALGRMQPREHREEVSVPRGREKDARVAERQREDRSERGPQDEARHKARDRPAREHRDEVRDRGLRAHGLRHRKDGDDAGVHENVEDRHREDRDDDDARDRLRRLDDLLREVADAVVAEVIVHGEDERQPEPAEDAGGRRNTRRGDDGRLPEPERLELQVREAESDHDPERREDADPEDDRELPDRADPAHEKKRDGDAQQRRHGRFPPVRNLRKDEVEIAREADRPRGHRERGREDDLEEEQERHEPAPARGAVRLSQESVGASRARQLGRQLGRDEPVRDREHGAEDPGAERAAAAHRGEDEGKGHEGPDPHHIDDVQSRALPKADLPFEYAFWRRGYAHPTGQ